MLTRNLIKLDDVETHGDEEVRTKRKETVKRIQNMAEQLDAKAKAPAGSKGEEERVETSADSSVNEGEATVSTTVAGDGEERSCGDEMVAHVDSAGETGATPSHKDEKCVENQTSSVATGTPPSADSTVDGRAEEPDTEMGEEAEVNPEARQISEGNQPEERGVEEAAEEEKRTPTVPAETSGIPGEQSNAVDDEKVGDVLNSSDDCPGSKAVQDNSGGQPEEMA